MIRVNAILINVEALTIIIEFWIHDGRLILESGLKPEPIDCSTR